MIWQDPDLNEEYKRIATSGNPITDELFGDDLGQQVKDITETNKLKSKLVRNSSQPTRGRGTPRGRGSNSFRGKPNYWRGRGSSRGGFKNFPVGNSQGYWNPGNNWAPNAWNGGNAQGGQTSNNNNNWSKNSKPAAQKKTE